jgi:outer membrane protein assembly factor BamB
VLTSAEISDQSAAPAALWGTSAVAPQSSGRVELLSIATGRPAALPFLPALSPSEFPAWTRPAVLADGSAFVIGDGRQMLYRVALKEQPRANLAAAKEQPFDQPLTGGLVTAQDTVYGLVKGPTGDTLVAIDPQSLTQSAKWPLSGRALFAPESAAGKVFIASEADGLLCLDAGQKLLWQKPLAHGPLAGPPVAGSPGELLLNFQDGTLARISAESGDELAARPLGEPLGRAACVVGEQAVVSTSDGVLLITPLP